MTVAYTSDIMNGGKFVCFWRVLYRWRGSLYKLIWQDLVYYCVLFAGVYFLYTYVLTPPMQLLLQQVKGYLSTNITMFPIPFVLSFFIDQVATKWWHQYMIIPSSDTLAIFTNAAFPGRDDESRVIRRTIVRYAVLSLVLTLRNISVRVKKRFPTIKHVQEAGFIMEEETIHYDKLEGRLTANTNNWLPLVWATNVATHAKSLNKVSSDQCLRLVISELTAHRNKLGILVEYDLVNIPLVYTQIMVVIVVSYVLVTLVSQQPILEGVVAGGFTITALLDFIIYVGLMKVASVMLNPFGEDDDDFEVNASIDRHLKAAYMIVDEMHEEEPEVVKDTYWDEIVPHELPYTVGAMGYRKLEPDYSDSEPQTPTKQSKNRHSFRRSWKFQRSKSKKSTQNNIPLTDRDRSMNGKINKGFQSTESLERDFDSEVYDCPEPTVLENFQPSTSKHFSQLPKRL